MGFEAVSDIFPLDFTVVKLVFAICTAGLIIHRARLVPSTHGNNKERV